MTSNINPNNIDGAYPVAGQDNNTQGFRTNFTNIITNFEYAAEEITALQANAVITGSSSTNYMNGAVIYGAVLQDTAATRVSLGTVSGTVTVDYAAGHYQTMTLGGSTTIAFNTLTWPASAKQAWIILRVTVSNLAYTLTLPSVVGTGASAASVLGIQGISSNVITFNETGTYEFAFNTEDQGSTVYLHELTRPRNRWMSPLFLTGSQALTTGQAANTRLTTSYFSTSGASTGTLAAGADGQIKVLAMSAASGNMVFTVTNAGWKSSGTGTITFSAIGQACTLMYTNSKWYCIGNNGAVFA